MFLTRLYPDPILTQVCDEVFVFDKNLADFVTYLTSVMYKSGGSGIAAPQVGTKARICVLELNKEPTVFINPTILDTSKETFVSPEGCLSIPGIRASIQRPKQLTVEAFNIEGKLFKLTLFNMAAAALQHETDHLKGLTIFDQMGPAQRHIKKNRYFKKWKKWKDSKEGKEHYSTLPTAPSLFNIEAFLKGTTE